eukprot:CAMPEP_0115010678 /NCGR_PEP_ID=MMETSP0216-20121206/23472_1 /TAXON_ID=223996 /ORGANISM="Protocruzia adherens, Strain Boccale" /LENGTH=652 /DNA_ID=CAMNT_0002378965 /DNA_START=158 /DNA_END=2116 /DNA_ORIENTATION=-
MRAASQRLFRPTLSARAKTLGLGLGLYWALDQTKGSKSHSCGITAYCGEQAHAADVIIEGLEILQNRGYDSAGVCTLDGEGELEITKYASLVNTDDSIARLKKEALEKHANRTIGIGHTRWATHGGKTDENAHPHADWKNRIALIHNGTVSNDKYLRGKMSENNIPLKSETDTELIANYIGLMMDQGEKIEGAIKKALAEVEGTWGLVVLEKGGDQLYCARNGSPLLIGIGQKAMYIASEAMAFQRYTSNFIQLNDGEIAVVNHHNHNLDMSRIEQAEFEKVHTSPQGYPHFTIQEIMEQPDSIMRALNHGARLSLDPTGGVKLSGLDVRREELSAIENFILTGCGTSYYAALYGIYLMRKFHIFNTVYATNSSETYNYDLPREKAGLCAITQSGETLDVYNVVKMAIDNDIPCFAVVNKVGSLIARTAESGIYVNAGYEQAVASTKAFTSQVIALSLVTAWMSHAKNKSSKPRKNLIDSLHKIPTLFGMALKNLREPSQEVAKMLENDQHLFILGKGPGEAIAMEGALKIKEITYLHTEGFAGGALKHGPLALITDGTPVILLILDDNFNERMITALMEVRGRGAKTIVITDNPAPLPEGKIDYLMTIPSNDELTALVAVAPLQLIAYELSVLKGINPDKPRNLSKTITVA